MARVQWAVWILLVSLLASSAYAATYSIDVQPVRNEIFRNDSAVYEISISNFGIDPAQFQAYTIDTDWNIRTIPVNFLVPPGITETFTLQLRPTSTAPAGVQGVPVTFKDLRSGVLIKKDIIVGLRHEGLPGRQYEPTIALDVLMPYEIDPRTPLPLRLELRNRNALDIENLTIELRSPHFSRETTASLAPLSEKTVEIPGVELDPLTAPGQGDLLVRIIHEDELITQLTKNYKIIEYTQIRERVTENEVFFKTTKTVVVTNDGNIANTAIVSVPTSLLKSLFTGSSKPYERTIEEGQRYLVWSIPLAPDETMQFIYTENYRIIILLALLGIGGWIAYLILRSPIVVLKEAVGIAKGDGVSQIKVRIFLKNRSPRLIQHIQATDRVPSLAEVLKTTAPGSIAPSKIATSEKQGTLLRWQLEVLEPYEERVLTYNAKSKLKIIGKMSLPRAKVRFTSKGKERVVYSNNIELVERFKDR